MVFSYDSRVQRYFIVFAVCLLLLFGGRYLTVGSEMEEMKEDQKPVSEGRIVIKNNNLGDSGFGIYLGSRADEIVLENNYISKNAEGIRLLGTKNFTYLRRNEVVDNVIGLKIQDTYSDNDKGAVKKPVDLQKIIREDNVISDNELQNILKELENDEEAAATNDGSDDTAGEEVAEPKETGETTAEGEQEEDKTEESEPEEEEEKAKDAEEGLSETDESHADENNKQQEPTNGNDEAVKKNENSQRSQESDPSTSSEEEVEEDTPNSDVAGGNSILWVGGAIAGSLLLLILS